MHRRVVPFYEVAAPKILLGPSTHLPSFRRGARLTLALTNDAPVRVTAAGLDGDRLRLPLFPSSLSHLQTDIQVPITGPAPRDIYSLRGNPDPDLDTTDVSMRTSRKCCLSRREVRGRGPRPGQTIAWRDQCRQQYDGLHDVSPSSELLTMAI